MKRRISILIPGMVYALLLLILLSLLFFCRHAHDNTLLWLSIGAVVVVLAAGIHFITGVYYPLSHMISQVDRLREGTPLDDKQVRSADEFACLEDALQEHAERLVEVQRIIGELSEGNIGMNIPVAGSRDELGESLVRLRASIMRLNIESQKRRKVDEQQNWASKGLAMFGELFRDADPDPGQLPSAFIRELSRYMEVEMGAIFLLQPASDGKPTYTLKGTHAYDLENQTGKSFEPGEGLVGRCAAGKETLVITDVPEDYIRIRSGMGEGNPVMLILVPVVFDAQVLGVIELATFGIVKQYKVEFLKRLGNSMGSTFSKVVSRLA